MRVVDARKVRRMTAFRLREETIGKLDRIADFNGLSSRTAAVEFLAEKEHKQIDQPRKRRGK